MNELRAIRPLLEEFIRTASIQQTKPAAQPRKITEVLESMLLKVNNGPEENIRKRSVITKLLNEVGLTLDNDYSEFHNIIPCIQFIENHPIKHLKNEASERIVPINPQLIDVGFLNYVKRNQTKREASGKDFIFPKCETKVKTYNKKFPRTLFNFLTDIGIKGATSDRLDFHSFRNNASVGMQEAGISGTYINSIIGWEGKTTMEQSYSKYTLAQIKTQVDRFSYGFLAPHFTKWKGVMGKK